MDHYSFREQEPRWWNVFNAIDRIDRKVTRIMTSIQGLQSAVADLQAEDSAVMAGLGTVEATLADLASKVAAGDPISQADIDAATAAISQVKSDLASGLDQLTSAASTADPAPTQPAPPADTPADGAALPDVPTS